jgi:hypothetical protein
LNSLGKYLHKQKTPMLLYHLHLCVGRSELVLANEGSTRGFCLLGEQKQRSKTRLHCSAGGLPHLNSSPWVTAKSRYLDLQPGSPGQCQLVLQIFSEEGELFVRCLVRCAPTLSSVWSTRCAHRRSTILNPIRNFWLTFGLVT